MFGIVPLLSLIHVAAGFFALLFGVAIFLQSKGDRRQCHLGWIYVALMLTSLSAILIHGASEPKPFHGYAVVVGAGIIAALLTSRMRSRVKAWRTWHAVLMSFSMLAAIVAVGGVIGGVALGLGKGPVYYKMFNTVIVLLTLAGLWVINTRTVIWGQPSIGRDRVVRLWFNVAVGVVSVALVTAQWLVFR